MFLIKINGFKEQQTKKLKHAKQLVAKQYGKGDIQMFRANPIEWTLYHNGNQVGIARKEKQK